MIKSGDILQRVDTNTKLHDVFYASTGKHDNKRYERIFGMVRKHEDGEAYVMQLKAHGDIKVASKDKAAKIFGELYKNDESFRKSVEADVKEYLMSGRNKVDINNLSDKHIHKMYENFNSALPDIRESGSGADTKFYDKLKASGYGAIQDINDMKFSKYNSKNPLIVFDNSKNNIMVSNVRSLTNDANLDTKGYIEFGRAVREGYVKKLLTSGHIPIAAGGAAAGMYISDKVSRPNKSSNNIAANNYVTQYKKEHPNSNLSDNQIKRMYLDRK
jgi:hypothetical protein